MTAKLREALAFSDEQLAEIDRRLTIAETDMLRQQYKKQITLCEEAKYLEFNAIPFLRRLLSEVQQSRKALSAEACIGEGSANPHPTPGTQREHEDVMRNVAIFVISLPLLVLAIAWIPMGLAFVLAVSPLLLLLNTISALRGDEWDWGCFLLPPAIMFELYCETTGFFPRLQHTLERL